MPSQSSPAMKSRSSRVVHVLASALAQFDDEPRNLRSTSSLNTSAAIALSNVCRLRTSRRAQSLACAANAAMKACAWATYAPRSARPHRTVPHAPVVTTRSSSLNGNEQRFAQVGVKPRFCLRRHVLERKQSGRETLHLVKLVRRFRHVPRRWLLRRSWNGSLTMLAAISPRLIALEIARMPGYLGFNRCSSACMTSTLPFPPVWQKFMSSVKIASDCCVSIVVLPLLP